MKTVKSLMAVCALSVGVAANAGQLFPLAENEIPRMTSVGSFTDAGTTAPSAPELFNIKVWSMEIEPESASQNQNGEAYLGLEYQMEGSPTDVYALPIEGVTGIVDVIQELNMINVDKVDGGTERIIVTTSITVIVKTYARYDLSKEIEVPIKLDLVYSQYGYLEKVESASVK